MYVLPGLPNSATYIHNHHCMLLPMHSCNEIYKYTVFTECLAIYVGM